MTEKTLAAIAGGMLLVILCCAGSLGALFGGGDSTASGCDLTVASSVSGNPSTVRPNAVTPTMTTATSGTYPRIGPWNATQVGNAAIIIATGNNLGIPVRGWVIAVATAMQESTLHNYGNLGNRNDHDSLGLFQQRPSQGWGTPAQVTDPVHAATSFYRHLLRIAGWQTMPLTQAAQAVQRSAYPDAYAKWEQPAGTLVADLTGSAGSLPGCAPATIATTGWTRPVTGAITSGYRTPGRPHHDGVDIGVPEDTPIHAANAGTVTAVGCNAHTPSGNTVSCDIDGNRGLIGLGWYVTITHPEGISTTYGHQLRRPPVTVGDDVPAGTVIGYTGSSGDSSGPHLYFKILTPTGPTNPVTFMAAHGAPLR